MPFEMVPLFEVSSITTGSSNTVDASTEGEYPFYDRSQVIKRSNKYLFDTEAVIVPGEGTDFIPRYVFGKFDLHQRAYAVFPNDKIDGRFLYYAILNCRKHFSQVATGSTVKSLRLKSFELMKIPYPDKDCQMRISDILSSFDYLIQNISNINDNLLTIARSVYISYKNNHKCDVAVLSEISEINAKTCGINTFSDINYLDTSSITDGIIDCYQHLVVGVDKIPSRARRMVSAGDVIFSTVRPNQHHFGILTSIPNNCVVSTGFITINSTIKSVSNEIIYLEITTDDVVSMMQQIAESSTSAYPSIHPEDLGSIEIPIIQNNHSLIKTLKDIFIVINQNNEEITSLTNLKDYLLPKLMSGKIDVSDLSLPAK